MAPTEAEIPSSQASWHSEQLPSSPPVAEWTQGAKHKKLEPERTPAAPSKKQRRGGPEEEVQKPMAVAESMTLQDTLVTGGSINALAESFKNKWMAKATEEQAELPASRTTLAADAAELEGALLAELVVHAARTRPHARHGRVSAGSLTKYKAKQCIHSHLCCF